MALNSENEQTSKNEQAENELAERDGSDLGYLDWRETETKYWVAFNQIVGAGVNIRKLKPAYERLGSLEKLWKADPLDLKEMGEGPYGMAFLNDEFIGKFLEARRKIDVDDLVAKLKEADTRAYPYPHPQFPNQLRQLYDAPIVIYVRGHLDPFRIRCAIAMVGTRNTTSYGLKYAKQFSRELAERGIPIISGMAVGIDSLCHNGAIDAGGTTVAVLGCGPDHIYPSSNKPLYNKLLEKPGCGIISEYFPGTPPQKWMFPARNRIVSGLSEGVVVIEAGEDSGSLITARQAFEQSRQVFAVPGRIDAKQSAGCNLLISQNVAKLVGSVDQILAEFSWVTGKSAEGPMPVELFGREKEVLDLVDAQREPVHFDKLSDTLAISPGELSSALTLLELAGIVERLPGDFYQRH